MKVFLIILAVIVFLVAVILSLSAEATIIYDNGWHTSVQILFIKKDVELSKILNFVLFPEKAGKEAAEKKKQKKNKSLTTLKNSLKILTLFSKHRKIQKKLRQTQPFLL